MTFTDQSPTRRKFLHFCAFAVAGTALPHGALAVTPATPGALARDGAALIAGRSRLYRSGEGATGWSVLPDPGMGAVSALAARPGLILAGGDRGLAQSADGGQSWRRAGAGLPDLPVTALAFFPASSDKVLAVLATDGLWQSDDAGASWSFVMDRPWLAEAEQEVLALAPVNLASGMGGIWIYAGTAVGLTRVPDCFCRWQDVQPGDAMDALVAGTPAPPASPLPAGAAVLALVSAPARPERLYAGRADGVWASDDAGVNWRRASTLATTALAADPTEPDRLAALTADGVFDSRDGGASWSALAALPWQS